MIDEKVPNLVKVYKEKCNEYLNRGMYLKEEIKKRQKEPVQEGTGSGEAQKGKKDDKKEDEQNETNAKLKEALMSAIISEKPNVKWEDVAGLEKAKATLQEAIILPMKFPQLFVGKIKPWNGILLYGVFFSLDMKK